jgi:hypothetical protein
MAWLPCPLHGMSCEPGVRNVVKLMVELEALEQLGFDFTAARRELERIDASR